MTHITLKDLHRQIVPYSRLPLPVSEAITRSITRSLLINSGAIPFLMISEPGIRAVYPISSRVYIWKTEAWVNTLLWLFIDASDYLLYANIISVALGICFLLLTLGSTRHVGEWVHWLSWVPAVLSGGTAVVIVMFLGAVVVITLLSILFWVALGFLAIIALLLLVMVFVDV